MWRLLAAFLLLTVPVFAQPARPALMLWAWERPEDLRFIDPADTGVAYLARTVFLKDGRALVRPRMQPLRVPEGAYVCAVVRIESDGKPHTVSQREAIASVLKQLASKKEVSALQLDYDALRSEREFYISLVQELHRSLPAGKPLSITALASWCMGDRWIAGLPVQEAVPMLFRMGPDGAQILRLLSQGDDFVDPHCRESLGISTDEPAPAVSWNRRLYVFHPQPWTAEAVRKLKRTYSSGGGS